MLIRDGSKKRKRKRTGNLQRQKWNWPGSGKRSNAKCFVRRELSQRNVEIEIQERHESMVIARDRRQELFLDRIEQVQFFERLIDGSRSSKKRKEVKVSGRRGCGTRGYVEQPFQPG